MNNYDEILLEQYFTYINMNENDRNLIISILLNTKDIEDSEYSIDEKSSNKYDLLTLHLINSDGIIKFNGAVYNEVESRFIDGTVSIKKNKILVKTSVQRLYDLVEDYDREYEVFDMFVLKNGKVHRRSSYDSGTYYDDEVVLMNNDEVCDYLQGKVDGMKKGRI